MSACDLRRGARVLYGGSLPGWNNHTGVVLTELIGDITGAPRAEVYLDAGMRFYPLHSELTLLEPQPLPAPPGEGHE